MLLLLELEVLATKAGPCGLMELDLADEDLEASTLMLLEGVAVRGTAGT